MSLVANERAERSLGDVRDRLRVVAVVITEQDEVIVFLSAPTTHGGASVGRAQVEARSDTTMWTIPRSNCGGGAAMRSFASTAPPPRPSIEASFPS